MLSKSMPLKIGAPRRHHLGEEDVECVVPELTHPVRFVFDIGDLVDYLVSQAFFGLENGIFFVAKAVLVLVFDAFKVL